MSCRGFVFPWKRSSSSPKNDLCDARIRPPLRESTLPDTPLFLRAHCNGSDTIDLVELPSPTPMASVASDRPDILSEPDDLYEFIDGRVVEKPTGAYEFWLAALICKQLNCSIDASSFTLNLDEDALRMIHPALVNTPSTVLHHFGVDPRYAKWRSHLKARLPARRSRNTTQLTLAGGSVVASRVKHHTFSVWVSSRLFPKRSFS
jgi:hypothetical protein